METHTQVLASGRMTRSPPSRPQIVEGSEVNIPMSRQQGMGRSVTVSIDTSQILFIAGGAFVGLDNIVKARSARSTFGFNAKAPRAAGPEAPDQDWLREVEHRDLVSFGMIPEFTGRFPVLSVLGALSEDDLVRVLTEPRDALCKQYQARGAGGQAAPHAPPLLAPHWLGSTALRAPLPAASVPDGGRAAPL